MRQHRLSAAKRMVCALGACAVGVCVACSEPRGPLSVKSDDPTLKIPAIEQDVRQKNTKDVAQMVVDLNNDDPAVRFYAIQGLHRLTGDDFGYHYYDDDDARQPAVQRWNAWLKGRAGK